ncbi:hypothetical protein Y032_0104g3622 [Ancylostoma ceylanicum]|uniref:Uncharacterized protein n=1 Tax=Ancylostoma ceylanicum TaxID=53326 RepID=A0A016TGI9_9BILA|nr:hypothetical protein Y032_0104g3622 [Ancylostoma ceylanicum]
MSRFPREAHGQCLTDLGINTPAELLPRSTRQAGLTLLKAGSKIWLASECKIRLPRNTQYTTAMEAPKLPAIPLPHGYTTGTCEPPLHNWQHNDTCAIKRALPPSLTSIRLHQFAQV